LFSRLRSRRIFRKVQSFLSLAEAVPVKHLSWWSNFRIRVGPEKPKIFYPPSIEKLTLLTRQNSPNASSVSPGATIAGSPPFTRAGNHQMVAPRWGLESSWHERIFQVIPFCFFRMIPGVPRAKQLAGIHRDHLNRTLGSSIKRSETTQNNSSPDPAKREHRNQRPAIGRPRNIRSNPWLFSAATSRIGGESTAQNPTLASCRPDNFPAGRSVEGCSALAFSRRSIAHSGSAVRFGENRPPKNRDSRTRFNSAYKFFQGPCAISDPGRRPSRCPPSQGPVETLPGGSGLNDLCTRNSSITGVTTDTVRPINPTIAA